MPSEARTVGVAPLGNGKCLGTAVPCSAASPVFALAAALAVAVGTAGRATSRSVGRSVGRSAGRAATEEAPAADTDGGGTAGVEPPHPPSRNSRPSVAPVVTVRVRRRSSRPIEPPVTDTLPIYLPSSALTHTHGDRSKKRKVHKSRIRAGPHRRPEVPGRYRRHH